MSISDPISDMLTRIRNGLKIRCATVDMPYSKMKAEIAQVLKREGYLDDCEVEGTGPEKVLRVQLKYHGDQMPSIVGLRRISRPGLRRYAAKDKLPRVLGGLGVAILTTSRGIMTDREARRTGVGGEILCYVW